MKEGGKNEKGKNEEGKEMIAMALELKMDSRK